MLLPTLALKMFSSALSSLNPQPPVGTGQHSELHFTGRKMKLRLIEEYARLSPNEGQKGCLEIGTIVLALLVAEGSFGVAGFARRGSITHTPGPSRRCPAGKEKALTAALFQSPRVSVCICIDIDTCVCARPSISIRYISVSTWTRVSIQMRMLHFILLPLKY